MEILILTAEDVKKCIDYKNAFNAIKLAFNAYGDKKALMPSKVYLPLGQYQGDLRAMPAYLNELDLCGLKWVNSHPMNHQFPTVMAVLILNDPKTGAPIAIINATELTSLRTGAAGALASSCLAKPDASKLALVGTGVQAYYQLRVHMEIFNFDLIRLYSSDEESMQTFREKIKGIDCKIEVTKSVAECVSDVDIICTTTPSTEPVVWMKDLCKGVHINAMGADAPGKQELDFEILKSAKVVVDDWEQSAHGGEINLAVKRGIISKEDIYTHLGQIVCAQKKVTYSPSEITVFDSTGLAIQDIAVGHQVYEKAIELGMGLKIPWG